MNPSIPSTSPNPLPSHAFISNTGEHGTPQAMADLLSAAFSSGVSIQDNPSTGGGFVPHEDRWYCIFRGRHVGPIQGW